VIRSVLIFLACAAPLWAQSWDTLRGLKPGESIRVVDDGGHELRGAFAAATADSLTLRSGGGEHAIEKSKIRVVKVRSSSRRLRNLLIGVGVGVATGAVVDQTLGAALRNETGDSKRPLTYVAPIALFGGIAGALPAYRTVYRAR
jgi:hypothetical protein